MPLTLLPDGSQRFDKPAAHYSMQFGPGWTLDTAFPRHDFRATTDTARLDGIEKVDVFTQFLPELASQSATDFLDNFGHTDFDDMVAGSYGAEFVVAHRGEVPVRQRMVNGRVWFAGDYRLTGRTTGAVALLRYAMAFERGTFYHLKGYFTADDTASGEAAFEQLLEGFQA